TVVVLFGMLRWISDLFGVTDILHSAWHLVDHLFLPEPVRNWLMAIGVPVIPASKRRHLQFPRCSRTAGRRHKSGRTG
ncbi:MAG TPA: hypothetical protein VN695_12895, partial [Streptosporangiaceae bacterium]|nr:hypothetical protein [Streptosporangiaceae bacterium]